MIEANKIVERIGLIDLGSNTARLVIFDVLEGGYFMVADEMVEAVRLGETEIDGSLKQTRVMQAINTVKVFKKLCAVFRVDSPWRQRRCVARRINAPSSTRCSALRDSNSKWFPKRRRPISSIRA